MAALNVFSDRTLKVSHEGDTRRAKLQIADGAAASQVFSIIKSTVASMFGMQQEQVFKLGYLDEEGDLCTLTEQTLYDLALIAPDGVLRLTLKTSAPDGTTQASDTDACACAVPDHDSPRGDSDKNELRQKLTMISQKLDPSMKALVKGFAQSMDPMMLHNMVNAARGAIAAKADKPAEMPDEGSVDCDMKVKDLNELLCSLHKMDAHAMRALIVEVLGDSGNGECSANTTAGPPSPPDFLATLFQALSGGKGSGEGACAGDVESSSSSTATSDGQQFANPLGTLFQALGAKGQGKGGCMANAPAGGPGPLNSLFQSLAGKGEGQGDSALPNPLEHLLGAMFKGKGCGRGANAMPHASDPAASAQGDAPNPDDANNVRVAFEQSVNDLVDMGLVSDPQVARELLTQHGDISTVVSVLAENE